jgi:hypothetical protein
MDRCDIVVAANISPCPEKADFLEMLVTMVKREFRWLSLLI